MRFRLSPGVCLAYALSLILGSAFFSGLTASPFEPYTRDGREFSEFLERCADQISFNRVPLCRVNRIWLDSNSTGWEDGFAKNKCFWTPVEKQHFGDAKPGSSGNTEADCQFKSLRAFFSSNPCPIWHGGYDPNGLYGNAKIISQNTQPDTTEEKASKGHPNRFVGYTMLGSGLFLSSWGIVSWEMKEYQECPPRNTDNVIKIVAGILLINAALFYLFGGCDQGSF